MYLAHIPLFLYPFLNTTSKSRPFEYLRLTSLGVIGALVKSDSPPTIEFLLTTEIIPLCLRIMETGSELSKVHSPPPQRIRLLIVDCRNFHLAKDSFG